MKRASRIPKTRFTSLVQRLSFPTGYSFLVDEQELLSLDPSRHGPVLGLAIDIGTITLSVSLCNLENGDEVASVTSLNRQLTYGADVKARLSFSAKSDQNRNALGRAVVESINQAIRDCAEKAGSDPRRIFTVIMVGNPVMHQFLFRMPVTKLSRDRFAFTGAGLSQVKARILELKVHSNANVRFLPAVDGAVGSDCLATIISLGIDRASRPQLCVDLGSNGTIIIGWRDKIAVASTTIGPAFEGYHIKCGMIAKPGAIEWIRIENQKVRFLTIGHIHPEGLCGSGIIDLVGELRQAGKIDDAGRMAEKRFVVYEDRDKRIEFTQEDVRRIQASKAAVHAGIQVLRRALKLKARDIQRVYLAGALGDYLNADHIDRLGILPRDLRAPLAFAGNTAFVGVKRSLMDRRVMERIIELSGKVRHLSLHEHPAFFEYFRKALAFPKVGPLKRHEPKTGKTTRL